MESLERRVLFAAVVTVTPTVVGTSTEYIGVSDNLYRYDPAVIRDLGVNAYRMNKTFTRLEPANDTEPAARSTAVLSDNLQGHPSQLRADPAYYGRLSLESIASNPDLIPWDVWERNFDHRFAPGFSMREALTDLTSAGVRVVMDVANVSEAKPDRWLPLPLNTTADWNEWQEHVFAVGYLMNVRHGGEIRVDDYEILNEPEKTPWDSGTVAARRQSHFRMLVSAHEALEALYSRYLPGRTFRIHAPSITTDNEWARTLLDMNEKRAAGEVFDVLNVHNYGNHATGSAAWNSMLRSEAQSHLELWYGEWGLSGQQLSATLNYDTPQGAVGVLMKNLIIGSTPGSTHVDGMLTFSLWGDFQGTSRNSLIHGPTADKRLGYYAQRMAARALAGGKTVLKSQKTGTDAAAVQAIATTQNGKLFVLLANTTGQAKTVDVALSNLPQYQQVLSYSEIANGGEVNRAAPALTSGRRRIQLGGYTAGLLVLGPRDASVPTVLSASYQHDRNPPTVTFRFSEDVSRSLTASDVVAVNVATGAGTAATSVEYSPATNTATFRFPRQLLNANYRVSFAAGAVADAGGNALRPGVALEFFSLFGDVNRDRVVNSFDLNIVTSNLGLGGMTYAQGDLNGDGVVNSGDYVIVAGNFGRTLPAPASVR